MTNQASTKSVIDRWMKEGDVASILGCSTSKLQHDRWLGRGIPYVRDGRSIFYKRSDVDRYMDERRVVPTGKLKSEKNSQHEGGDQ